MLGCGNRQPPRSWQGAASGFQPRLRDERVVRSAKEQRRGLDPGELFFDGISQHFRAGAPGAGYFGPQEPLICERIPNGFQVFVVQREQSDL